MWISSWTTEGSCGGFEKVVDSSLLLLARSALLDDAGSVDREAVPVIQEIVEPAERTIECVQCGQFAEGTATGWKAYLGGGSEVHHLKSPRSARRREGFSDRRP